MAAATHDVPETDPPRLAVPEEPAHEHQRDEAEDGGQRDGECFALGEVDVVFGGEALLGEVEP